MDCFVIMPFGNPAVDPVHHEKMESLYTEWIKPTVEAIPKSRSEDGPWRCHRADKERSSGDIIDHTIESILKAQLVIADLTGKNANVFYELGVRHAVSNSTLLVAEGTDDIPFDLHSLRAIIYKYTPSGMLRFQKDLTASILSIVSQPDRVDNPVRRIIFESERSSILSKQTASSAEVARTLSDELTALRTEFKTQYAQMTSLFSELTKKPVAMSSSLSPGTLAALQGIWRSADDSMYCLKVVGDELRGVYSFQQTRHVTGYFYNCQAIGGVLLCRFQWFSSRNPNVYVVALRMEDAETLKGGWRPVDGQFTNRDLGKSLDDQLPSLSPDDPELIELLLRKDLTATMPDWANEYFRNPSNMKRLITGRGT